MASCLELPRWLAEMAEELAERTKVAPARICAYDEDYRYAVTACGPYSSAFYCATDDTIGLELGYLDRMVLRYGKKGAFIILAHEWSHAHARRMEGGAVARTRAEHEAFADCYSGMFATVAAPVLFAGEQGTTLDNLFAWACEAGDDPDGDQVHGTCEARVHQFRRGMTAASAQLPTLCDGRRPTATVIRACGQVGR
jgi:predicted metalloprotease